LNFLKKIKKPVASSREIPEKITIPPARKPPRREVLDSDGELRRTRQLIEQNRLI
jgi:hypothetical protein